MLKNTRFTVTTVSFEAVDVLLLSVAATKFCRDFCYILWMSDRNSVFFPVENMVAIGKEVLQEQMTDVSKAR